MENNGQIRCGGAYPLDMERKWYHFFTEDVPDTPPETTKPLTKAQREAILQRDEHTSQMRHYSEDRGFYNNKACPYDNNLCTSLQVHHIQPRRAHGGNEPENLITIFECEHVGRCKDNRIK